MSGNGRPLRFAIVILGGWTAVRVMMLWPQAASLSEAIRAATPVALARSLVIVAPNSPPPPASLAAAPRRTAPRPTRLSSVSALSKPISRTQTLKSPIDLVQRSAETPSPLPAPAIETYPSLRSKQRWQASAWTFVRQGSGDASDTTAPTLGASQAGARLSYSLIPAAGIAANARVSAPLQGRGAEAAIGLTWQPTPSVTFLAEQRFGVDGQAGGPAIAVIGGGSASLATLNLETYAEAGAVLRDRVDYYAGGAARLTRPVATIADGLPIAFGIGAWGSVQRDSARLDIGPAASVALPVPATNMRLTIEWRERVAGNARPESGLALTLGADF